MAKLHILSKAERKAFNSPPSYTIEGRRYYFNITKEVKHIIDAMRSETNKIGFIIQLGYFKYVSRFFVANQFHRRDVDFVANLLNIDSSKINIEEYNDRKFRDHQKIILLLQGFSSFNDAAEKIFLSEIDRLVSKQVRPKTIILKLAELLMQGKFEIPSYNQFSDAIVAAENKYEALLLDIIEKHLSTDQQEKLDALIPDDKSKPSSKFYHRSPITKLKNIIQSLRPEMIKENVNRLVIIKSGSVMIWRHINFNGEYDFREKIIGNDPIFDIDKILGWQAA